MRYIVYLLVISNLAGARAQLAPDAHDRFRALGRRTSLRQLVDADRWIGIIGDSGVTGAASSPNLTGNVFTLLNRVRWFLYDDHFTAYVPPGVEPLTRVVYSQREYDEAAAKGGLVDLNGGAKGSLVLDVPEHGFGYRVARDLGVAAPDVVMVGQDGKRVSAIPTQLERLYEMDTATLPPLVFISFTANDFCDAKALEEPVAERARRFRNSLAGAWEAARPYLNAHRLGTRFVVLAPLEIANVLANPEILRQRVPLGTYGTVSCREMRAGEVEYGPVAEFVAARLVNMCPSVLGTRPDDAARVARLREIQDAFNQVWKDQVAELNRAYPRRGLSWTYVEDVRELAFTEGDVANDCFHPGRGGHAKIAELLKQHLGPRPFGPSAE